VANGADAIFFGLSRFNARLRADNFTDEDLPELMRFLHSHGVRGYVTFNTLVFTSELADAARQLQRIHAAGVDAVIVQDLGLARMVKELAPGLRLHASTQMTLTSPEGLAFAQQLKIDQAVLARELSLRELERFQKSLATTASVPLEVFVHGALCVAYSGQCLTSESLGRRSANRGECAQACRMPYEMIVDGAQIDLGDKRYLLSPQDLAAVEEIPDLMRLGIRCFKIEGRLKTPEYVAAVCQVYRKAIDAAWNELKHEVTAEDWYAMEMTFSRGLYPGWMHGVNHQELVGAYYGKKRGPYVGRIKRVINADTVELDELTTDIKPGDGVVFENLDDTNAEQGGSVYERWGRQLSFQRGKLRMEELPVGTRIFKTSDPALYRRLRASFENELPLRKQHGLMIRLTGEAGKPLTLICRGITLESAMPLQVAIKRPLTVETVSEQLGRLGATAYELSGVDFQVHGAVMLPLSELNRLRRELLEKLDTETEAVPARPEPQTTLQEMLQSIPYSTDAVARQQPALHALCRTQAQIDAALNVAVPRLYIDFEDIRLYADAVQKVRQSGASAEVWLATPRIQKSGEAGFFKLIERAEPDGVLIRNLGALTFFEHSPLRLTGDFSLNVANPLTAHFLKQHTRLQQLTVSYDLTLEQVLDLLNLAEPSWFELTLHQHMPMFHMEHCVFAAFMSEGKDFNTCGRPCERHRVHLRDRVGMEHPLKADVGCRNTLYNSVAQTGAGFYSALLDAGLRQFRVELLEQDYTESKHVLAVYQELLAGKRSGDAVWRELRALSQLGVTRGTMADLNKI
jgi:putative protease